MNELRQSRRSPNHRGGTALLRAREMLDADGLSFGQIRFRREISTLLNLPQMLPSTDLLRRNAYLEEQEKTNKRAIDALRREVERLRKEVERHGERYRPREDGSYPWATSLGSLPTGFIVSTAGAGSLPT